ncbi:MAG: hypothetical protein LW650_10470 [Planctomycetaceae bacterium]|jgi:hypothetical protein|nr:hypothetical protein [Planctomycetaceae bacterium]
MLDTLLSPSLAPWLLASVIGTTAIACLWAVSNAKRKARTGLPAGERLSQARRRALAKAAPGAGELLEEVKLAAEEATAAMDAKVADLQRLIAEADAKLADLRLAQANLTPARSALVTRPVSARPSSTHSAQALHLTDNPTDELIAAASVLGVRSGDSAAAPNPTPAQRPAITIAEQVRLLAEQGLGHAEIAQATGQQISAVRLMLSLRKAG